MHTALSKGQTPGPENSIGKLVAGATMQELAMFALDLQGQAGVMMDADAPQNARFQGMLLRSPATRIEGGSDEILRNIIGERVLGCPATSGWTRMCRSATSRPAGARARRRPRKPG